jgi:serine phosphatase RsbU (regulator of sigma subunit)/anti-sigma regulatory factor (Ser/Thr protein kinase)
MLDPYRGKYPQKVPAEGGEVAQPVAMEAGAPTPANPGPAGTTSAPELTPETQAGSRRWWRRSRNVTKPDLEVQSITSKTQSLTLDIAPNDPVLAFLQGASGPVDVSTLPQDSPAVADMRDSGVELVVPLVASGEMVGLLALGQRLSERGYSHDDRRLLDTLARYAAPALRLGQMVRQQQGEARVRERIEQELRVAQLIQQQFLPQSLPNLAGWDLSAFYLPARTVGGDFYDVMELPDGRIMVVTGDVTDKGVPAALVMASTHALLREAGPRLISPAAVLGRVNELLCTDIPAHMFVTCLVLVFDRDSGEVQLANAGHNLPFVRGREGVRELRATGMPLGLMPESSYDEVAAVINPGEVLLLYSDGITEQHNDDDEMFGFGRTQELVGQASSGPALVDTCVSALERFSGNREQEDDVTLVTLERSAAARPTDPEAEEVLSRFSVPSEPGNERLVLARVAEVVADSGLTVDQLERIKTASAEAAMNAIEHGNHNRAELPVDVVVLRTARGIAVEISDLGGRVEDAVADTPDLELKLAGLQTTRGWGLFLIENMVDECEEHTREERHTVRLVLNVDPSTADPAEKDGATS